LLYQRLTAKGYSLWFDEQNLLPGQNWQLEIQQAIRKSAAVLICLSSRWVNSRGYVQKELKMTLDVLAEIPEGKVFMIPIKLDECEVPPSLSQLHWVRLFDEDGYQRLEKAIDVASGVSPSTSPSVISRSSSAWHEFVEDIIAKGGMIHEDHWTSGNSAEEVAFKQLLKGRWETGMDFMQTKNWLAILELWQPLSENRFFRVDDPQWSDKPYYRCQIHAGKCQLFFAHVHLGQEGEFKKHVPLAFALLNEVLLGNPYSLKGASHDRLPTVGARTQNLNYRDTLNFALEWYDGWESCFDFAGVPEADAQKAKVRIFHRLSEIEFMLSNDPEAPSREAV
jgi:hypothetical protein